MRSSHSCLTAVLCGACAAGLTAAPAQAQSAAPIIAPVSPLLGAQGALDRAHRAKSLAELNQDLTSESAAVIGFSLVLADSMVSGLASGLTQTLTPKGAPPDPKAAKQQAEEKAFQDKVAALLDRYAINQKTMDASDKSGKLPPGLAAHGHQFLADAVALSDSYEKTHSSSKGGTLSEQFGKGDFPAPGACGFHVLSPTRVQIVPRTDPKSPLEAHLEDGRWRLDLGNIEGEGSSSSPEGPQFKAPKKITPQAAAFLKAIEDEDPVAVERQLKADRALANTPPALNGKLISQPPLSMAAFEGNTQIAALLIKYGADVNAEDHFQATALDKAAFFSNKAVAALLLAHGARIGHKDVFGQTALHQAVQGNDPGTVALMLAHGADVNARDEDGKTPLALALQYTGQSEGHTVILKLLRQHGAKK